MFLIGEADAGTVDTITACLEQAPSVGDIEVDLADITFLDLTALRVILQFGSELAAGDRSLTVVNPSRPVTLLLRVSGFDAILHANGRSAAQSGSLPPSASAISARSTSSSR